MQKAKNRPVRRILVDAYVKTGSVLGAAAEVGISPSTFNGWRKASGLTNADLRRARSASIVARMRRKYRIDGS